jgi:hypothetical protein
MSSRTELAAVRKSCDVSLFEGVASKVRFSSVQEAGSEVQLYTSGSWTPLHDKYIQPLKSTAHATSRSLVSASIQQAIRSFLAGLSIATAPFTEGHMQMSLDTSPASRT